MTEIVRTEDSVNDLYGYIDEDYNVFFTEKNGEPEVYIGERYENLLSSIEAFVDAIGKHDSDAFAEVLDRSGDRVVHTSELGHRAKCVSAFADAYSDEYIFSENVSLCFRACNKFHIELECFNHLNRFSMVEQDKVVWQRYNDFIAYIRSEYRTRAFRKRVYDREYKAIRNYESAKDYVDHLFAVKSRLLVIRLDLGYQKAFYAEAGLDKSRVDLDRLLNNRRSNKLFDAMVGYIWKLEYGVKKGYHYHCIFFFDGSIVQRDGYYANMIGNYWVKQITQGAGTMYSCNANKNIYRNCGIGMVNHTDLEKRTYLLRVIQYLTKKEQYLCMKLSGRRRVFGRGEISCGKSTVGRPRTQ